MTVNIEKLVRMAQQIAANMDYGEDADLVAQRCAGHINKYWDQRMRAEFKAQASARPDLISNQLQLVASKLD